MKKRPPKRPSDELVVVDKPGAIAPRQALEDNPLALYMASLRSKASRTSMLSALGRAAKIFDAFDRSITAAASDATAASYPWGAAGALSFAKVQAAVAIVAEELNDAGEPKAPMARLLCAALRGLARAAFNLRLLSVDERMRIDDVKAPDLSGKTRGRRLTAAEVQRLFAACQRDESDFGRRDAAILAVMLGTGLRRFEVSALDLRDYHEPVKVGRDPVVLTIRAGKGRKHADVTGSPDVAEALEAWLEARGRAAGPLFTSSAGRGRPLELGSRLSDSGIYLVCAQRGGEARVELAPHDLRRTFITTFIERTKDLALAQKAARHSDPKTTSKYDMRKQEALAVAFGATSSGYAGNKE